MNGHTASPIPCLRCREQRIKCDKRQHGCERCEKAALPCPGYNRVRRFIDVGKTLAYKATKANATKHSAGVSSPSARTVYSPNEATSSESECLSATAHSTESRQPLADTNSADFIATTVAEHGWAIGDDRLHEGTCVAGGQGTTFTTIVNSPAPRDEAFDDAYFDLDPEIYFADPANCCLLIPDTSQADTDSVDPLHSPPSSVPSPITLHSNSEQPKKPSQDTLDILDDEGEHEASHLIQYFSEFASRWLDIIDMENYFGSRVPVLALHSNLVKNSLAAVAAKQYGSILMESKSCERSYRPPYSCRGRANRETALASYSSSGSEWFYKAASYYDKAIGQMMISLQSLRLCCSSGKPFTGFCANVQNPPTSIPPHVESSLVRTPHKSLDCLEIIDNLLAAISVFFLYELLDNRQMELEQHMKGAHHLLSLQVGLRPQRYATDNVCPTITSNELPTKAWQSTFWNFAWTDYILSYTEHTAPQLDIDNALMWKAAGLPLCDSAGHRMPEALRDAELSPPKIMTEVIACRTMIWIVLKTLTHVACGQLLKKVSAGQSGADQSNVLQYREQYLSLIRSWRLIHQHLREWKSGLPDTFIPCLRIQPQVQQFSNPEARPQPTNTPSVFYSNAMCAAAALLYHVTSILLLLHKPIDDEVLDLALRSSLVRRLHAQRQVWSQIEEHTREVCALAVGQSTLTVRMHMPHALHLAGLCVETKEHRKLLIDLLMGIQDDTGYSTEWAIDHLRVEWELGDSNRESTMRLP